MKRRTLFRRLVAPILILTLTVLLGGLPTILATPTPPGPDTVLFDHFDNATVAQYVSGTLSYVDGPPGFGRAVDFTAGSWVRYNVPGWYQWPSTYDPTGKQGTLELWVYPQQYNISLVNFNWNNTTSYPPAGHILHLQITGEGKLAAGTWTAISGPPLTPLPEGTTTIPLNQWTHVAFTWGDAGTKLYVNGVLDASTPDNLYPALNSTFYVYVPYWGASGLGYIDELHILKTQVDYLPAPTTTQLTASSTISEIYPDDLVSVDLTIQNTDSLYAAQATCTVNSAVLQPQSSAFGDFFDPVNRLIGANVVSPTLGTWTGAISQRSPALPLSGNGLLATVAYSATAPGTTVITCNPLLSDRDGFTQTVTYSGTTVTVLPFAAITGTATYQGRLTHENITVMATGVVTRTATTDNVGAFTLDQLKASSYSIRAEANRYLPSCITRTVTSGQVLALPNTVLKGGDANGDEIINIGDATLIAANFGQSVPPAAERADINADIEVNIQDLAILGGNYELAGCQTW